MTTKNIKNVIIVVAVVVGIILLLELLGFGFRGYGMMGGYTNGSIIFGWIISVLFIILIIAGIYWFIKHTDHHAPRKR